MRTVNRWVTCAAAGFLMLLITGVVAEAQTVKQGTAKPIQSTEGVDTYQAYCAVCHGPKAKGDGPAATALKKVPADLTTIAKRNGGTFSAYNVEAMIKGADVASHGGRDMPIWGPVFKAMASDDAFAQLRLTNLVNYLKSIQVP